VDPKILRECLDGNAWTAGGYAWDYEDAQRRAAAHAVRAARGRIIIAKKGVWRIAPDGTRVLFKSGAEAARALRLEDVTPESAHAMISKCLAGKEPEMFGYRWEYVDDEKRAKAEETRSMRALLPTKKKPVWRIDRSNGTREPFDSVADAARHMGLDENSQKKINHCLHGRSDEAEGYGWEFRNDV
jgi:hypothetical protein